MIDPQQPDFQATPASDRLPLPWYAPQDPHALPAVSILTPFRNVGPEFHETARSVFRQSLQQFEWLIVDDCSDNTQSLALLAEYSAKDARVRVIRAAQHIGISAARNRGAAEARAGFLFFLDGDDLLEPTALEKLRWFLECRPNAAFARGYTVNFDAHEELSYNSFDYRNRFLRANHATITSMVRRAVFQAVGGMSENIKGGMEDWDFWLKCASHGYWGATLPEFLDWYRRRASHADRWPNLDGPQPERAFQQASRQKFPELFRTGIPQRDFLEGAKSTAAPFDNALQRSPDRKRILLIVPHFEMGGAEQFDLDLIQCLRNDHAYEVSIVATRAGRHPWRPNFERLVTDLFVLDPLLPRADYARFMRYLINSRDFDAVLITHNEAAYELLPELRQACPKPVYADYLHMEERWRNGGYAGYSLEHAAFLDLTLVASNHLKTWMVERGGNPARIFVSTINIDSQLWDRSRYGAAAIRAKYAIPPGVPVLVYAARLCDQKKPLVLAEVCKRLSYRGVRFICLVAGDGEYRSRVEKFIRVNSLGEMQLLGALSNAEVREILAIADIYFMPSKWEGISLAIYQAMAMEVVPVSSDVGGQRELVTDDCGVLIKPGPNALTDYTDALLELLADTEKRHAMAAGSRARVCQGFQLRDMGNRIASLLEHRPEIPSFDYDAARQEWQSALVPPKAPPPDLEAEQSARDYRAMLDVSARLARGNILLLPRVLQQAKIGLPELLNAAALVLSPSHFFTKLKDLTLLVRVLSHPLSRNRLLRQFDAQFYASAYPDVRRHNSIPLLHYALFGYREARKASRTFDVDVDLPPSNHWDGNPLLRQALSVPRRADALVRAGRPRPANA